MGGIKEILARCLKLKVVVMTLLNSRGFFGHHCLLSPWVLCFGQELGQVFSPLECLSDLGEITAAGLCCWEPGERFPCRGRLMGEGIGGSSSGCDLCVSISVWREGLVGQPVLLVSLWPWASHLKIFGFPSWEGDTGLPASLACFWAEL